MSQQQDPVESGALEDEPDTGPVEPPPTQQDPVESGALEDDPEH